MFRLVKIASVLVLSTSFALPAPGQETKPAKKPEVAPATAKKEISPEQRALAMPEKRASSHRRFEDAALKSKLQS